MNSIINPNIKFDYSGYFISKGEWIHPDRTEKTFEIICVTQGVVCLEDEISGKIEASKNTVLILDANTRHYGNKFSKNVRFYWVHFYFKGNRLPFSKRIFENFQQTQLFRELLHLCNLPEVPHYAVNAVLVHILSELCRLSEKNSNFDYKANEIYEYIRINANVNLQLKTVAEHFKFSDDHITRTLKATYNCGFKKLCDRFIMSKARELLCNTGLYIKEIAFQLGFSSDKAFIGFFKYHEGISPEQFRNGFSRTHFNNK